MIAARGFDSADDPHGPHPVFGPLSRRQCWIISYKHTDHHLRQFGV